MEAAANSTLPPFNKLNNALNTLDRLGIQTGKTLESKINQLRSLRDTFAEDAAVVTQLNARLNTLNAIAGRTTVATRSLSRSAGNTSQIFFQLGQAISDFNAAGIRGAANNIEFLAFQLGLGGPLILGITALTVGFQVFGEEIVNAINPGREAMKKLEEDSKRLAEILESQADALINISGQITGAFDIQVDTIQNQISSANAALREQARIQEEINKTIADTFVDLAKADPRDTARIEFLEGRLRTQQALLENSEDLQESIVEIRKELVEQLEQEEAKLAIINAGKRLGLDFTVDENTELGKALKKNEELVQLIGELERGERDQLILIQEQNKELEERAKKLREEIRIRQFLSEIDIRPSPPVAAFEQEDEFVGLGGGQFGEMSDLEETLSKLKPLKVEVIGISNEVSFAVQALGMDLNTFSEESILALETLLGSTELSMDVLGRIAFAASSQFEFMSNEWQKAVSNMIQQTEQLNQAFKSGFEGIFVSVGEGIAQGDPFSGLRNALGSFAQDVGKTLISFGFAGLALDAFIKNPATAIFAGTALVAAGAALKRNVSAQKDAFVSGNGQSEAGQAPGFVDPRQGRTGRLQRDTASFNESRLPFTVGPIEITGDFKLSGTNLTAAVERTQQRQTRTRG